MGIVAGGFEKESIVIRFPYFSAGTEANRELNQVLTQNKVKNTEPLSFGSIGEINFFEGKLFLSNVLKIQDYNDETIKRKY